MPRAVTPPYAYSLPAVYLAIPGTTILVDQHNTPLEDIANTFNTATPIQYGGTAATTLAGAQASLGISPQDQLTYPTATGTGDALVIANTTPILVLANRTPASFKASAANTTAATINVDALGAKAIRKISGGTDVALVANDLATGGLYQIEYFTAANSGAGAWVLAPTIPAATNPALTSNANFTNFALGTPTVAASALTIPFTGVDGNALSATNVAYINFRSATAGSGAIAQLALTALASLVISNGSTLGMTNGVAATLALAIFNDAGTARPAIINPLTLPIVDGIASATSEGGAGAADSAGVWYSNAAITNKAYTIVAYITVTEATAGTWATAPSTVQVGPAPAVNNALPIRSWSLASPVASTSGTSIDFTGIPNSARVIIVSWSGVSLSGTANPLIQLGTSGGVEITGYLGAAVATGGTSLNTGNFTAGIGVLSGVAANLMSGNFVISLLDSSTNTWGAGYNLGASNAVAGFNGGFQKSLSAVLDRVRMTTSNGTDTFDGGKINIMYGS